MTIVRHTITDVTGAPVRSGVSVRLATSGWVTGSTREVITSVVVTPDVTGLVSFDLAPQSQIDPLGTHYELTNPTGEVLSFTVPDGAGPFWVRDILVSNPAAPPAVTVGVPLTAAGRESLTLTEYAKLVPWFAALANRGAARANVVLLGASITEGFPTTASGSLARTIEAALAARLRAAYPVGGVTGGRGYVGVPTAAVAAVGWPLAFTGGSFDDSTFALGAKHRCWYTNGVGSVIDTLAAPVTSFDINHIAGTAGAAGGGYYKIDGGAPVAFSTSAATNTATKLHVASPASTSIEVGWNGAGYIILEGITEYNGDETSGVSVHNCGHSGFTLAQWAQVVSPPYPLTSVANLSPALLVLTDLGVNDASNGVTAAAFQTALTAFIAQVRAAGISCPIVLSATYDPAGGVALTDPWLSYVAAMDTVAAADSTVVMLDNAARMPATGAASTYGLYHTDLVHGAANGEAYVMMADTLAAAIAPR